MPKKSSKKKPSPTPPAPEVPAVQEESPALPIFMEWTVVERVVNAESLTKPTKHFADLCFQGQRTHTLEGPLASKMLQEHADRWNALRYIPKLEVHPGYFKTRPTADSFLERGRGHKPFVS